MSFKVIKLSEAAGDIVKERQLNCDSILMIFKKEHSFQIELVIKNNDLTFKKPIDYMYWGTYPLIKADEDRFLALLKILEEAKEYFIEELAKKELLQN